MFHITHQLKSFTSPIELGWLVSMQM